MRPIFFVAQLKAQEILKLDEVQDNKSYLLSINDKIFKK